MSKTEQREIKIYGVNACQAIFKTRPQDIIKAVLTTEKSKLFSPMLQYLAKNKKAYNVEKCESIDNFSKSIHHEGICLLVKTAPQLHITEWLKISIKNKTQLFILLENIDNPHNLGAIIRSASHFGVDAIFYSGKKPIHLDGSTIRVAQGGTEYVKVFHLRDWVEIIEYCLKNNFSLYATSDKAKNVLTLEKINNKSAFIFGNENSGLSTYWGNIKNIIPIQIHGTNLVESLNISVACAITMALYRQKFLL